MAWDNFSKIRFAFGADGLGDGAARMEPATRRRVDGRWNLAFEDDPIALRFAVRVGNIDGGQ